MTLKQRFLNAIILGELGSKEDRGIVVTLGEFKNHFKDINTRYITSFLPAAVIETGQYSITHTKFLFRIKKGIYLVHPDAIKAHKMLQKTHKHVINHPSIREQRSSYAIKSPLLPPKHHPAPVSLMME